MVGMLRWGEENNSKCCWAIGLSLKSDFMVIVYKLMSKWILEIPTLSALAITGGGGGGIYVTQCQLMRLFAVKLILSYEENVKYGQNVSKIKICLKTNFDINSMSS